MFDSLLGFINEVLEEMFPMSEARTEFSITDEQVAERAHGIFVERGGEHGRDVEDWLLAEAQLVEEASDAALEAVERPLLVDLLEEQE